jgi:hypothetical protein
MSYTKVTITKSGKITLPTNTNSLINLKSITTYNNQLLIGASDNTSSLIKAQYNSEYDISETQNLITYSGKDVRFVGGLGKYYGFIPKSQMFKIKYADFEDANSYDINLDNSDDMTSKIMDLIYRIDPCVGKCGCSHNKCFKLVGFFLRYYYMNMIVQLSCQRKPKNKKIYIITGKYDAKNMLISHELSISGIYDLYSMSKQNCITKSKAINMTFAGVSYNNDVMYLLTKSECDGYLWKVNISKTMNYFSSSIQIFLKDEKIFKLENYPIGLAQFNSTELMVLYNEYSHNKIPYNILTLS